MKDIRIVFMGTPDFAVGVLRSLIEHKYDVVGVITAPDRPAGRGRKLHQSAVKKYAMEHGLPVLQPKNLKDEAFIAQLKALRGNVQVVVAFRMLPEVVWRLPELGTFNLHASLLPEYRGAAPINWAIINGETKTGVTTFFIDEKIDTGAIILQEEVAIEETDTAGDLHNKLMETGSALVIKTVDLIKKGHVETIKQPDKELKPAPKIFKDTCKIDWTDTLDPIYNKIRGLSPYPAAWTLLENGGETLEVKIYAAAKEKVQHNFEAGSLIATKKDLKIAVRDGFLHVYEMQLAGKRKMKIKDLLNGYRFDKNAKVL